MSSSDSADAPSSLTTAMLIRKDTKSVFQAFVDPAVTSQFWFTKGSGCLEAGKTIEWTWEMYGFTAAVKCMEFVQDEKVVIEWPMPGCDFKPLVTFSFETLKDGCFVKIVADGFRGSLSERVARIAETTEGYTIVLAGAKAYLEHGIKLGLVVDRFPKDAKK